MSTWTVQKAEAAPELAHYGAQHSVKPALVLFCLKDRGEQLCDYRALHTVDKRILTGVPVLQIPCPLPAWAPVSYP